MDNEDGRLFLYGQPASPRACRQTIDVIDPADGTVFGQIARARLMTSIRPCKPRRRRWVSTLMALGA